MPSPSFAPRPLSRHLARLALVACSKPAPRAGAAPRGQDRRRRAGQRRWRASSSPARCGRASSRGWASASPARCSAQASISAQRGSGRAGAGAARSAGPAAGGQTRRCAAVASADVNLRPGRGRLQALSRPARPELHQRRRARAARDHAQGRAGPARPGAGAVWLAGQPGRLCDAGRRCVRASSPASKPSRGRWSPPARRCVRIAQDGPRDVVFSVPEDKVAADQAPACRQRRRCASGPAAAQARAARCAKSRPAPTRSRAPTSVKVSTRRRRPAGAGLPTVYGVGRSALARRRRRRHQAADSARCARKARARRSGCSIKATMTAAVRSRCRSPTADGNEAVIGAGLQPRHAGGRRRRACAVARAEGDDLRDQEAPMAALAPARRTRGSGTALGATATTPPVKPQDRRVRAKAGFNLSQLGARASGADALPDVVLMRAGLRGLLPARPGRRPAVHLPRDGGAHLLARRDRAAGGRAGDRQARDARCRKCLTPTRSAAIPSRASRRSFSRSRIRRTPSEVAQRLVHGAQEDRRHARHAAGRASRGRSSTTTSATSTA